MAPTIQRSKDGHGLIFDSEAAQVSFMAQNIQQQRTGTHARMSIAHSGIVVASDYMNIEKLDERVRLCNEAYRRVTGNLARASYSALNLKGEFDYFCLHVWEEWVAIQMPTEVEGDATTDPIPFILRPFILMDGGTILFAPPGTGKSYTAITMAVSIDAGYTKLWQVTQGRILFVNLERPAHTMARRIGSVNMALGLEPNRKLLILNARGRSLQDVQEVVQKTIDQHKVKLIVLDSISRAGMGDLTENSPANRIIDSLNGFGVPWLALAHTPRADDSHAFGSVHFDAGADIVVQLQSETKDKTNEQLMGIGLQITKANDLPKMPMESLCFVFTEFGLQNIRRPEEQEFPELASKRKVPITTTIAQFIQHSPQAKAGATEIAKAIGLNRSVVSDLLNRSSSFVKLDRDGREVLFGVRDTSYARRG